MLLLKKKKYAAVKVQFRDGTPYEVILSEEALLVIPLLEQRTVDLLGLHSLCRSLNARVLIWFVVTGA